MRGTAMVDRVHKFIRVYGLAPVLLATVMAGGCGLRSAPFPAYMHPDLLYLKDQPYTRLYVEVDVMEGVEIPQEWLDELEAFLSRHCCKPEGITVVRDEPVPASAVVDAPVDLVPILCTDGPPPETGDQSAYLHVVFYDSRKWPRQKDHPPRVYATCPTAIVCDVDYAFNTFKDRAAGSLLRHEAGHVLGLCRSAEHSDGSHCRNPGCLMRPGPGIGSQIGLLLHLPWKGGLCDACQRDLEASLTQTTPENLSFAGPFLVRHEDGYDIVRLPGGDLILVEPGDGGYPWQPMLTRVKERIRGAAADGTLLQYGSRSLRNPLLYGDVFYPTDVGPQTERHRTILGRAAQDPCPVIRWHARRFLERQAATETTTVGSP